MSAGCLNVNRMLAHESGREGFGETNPRTFGATDGAGEDLSRDRTQIGIDRNQAVRHQLIAEQPGLFARGFRSVAAQ